MGGQMLVATCLAAVAIAAVGALAVLLLRERRRTRSLLAESRRESEALRERLESLAGATQRPDRSDQPEFVITDAGLRQARGPERADDGAVGNQVVLSAALGEPLVRAAALAHGLRRALSAESRNRIRFAMRREVRRARKQRKQEMRQAWRRVRAEDHAA